MSTMKDDLAEKLTPLIISVVTVLIYIDTHSLHPFLSTYATELGATVLMAGLIVAAYSLFEDVFEVVFGYIMDRKGKRRIFLVGGLMGDGVNMLLYALSRNPIHLLLTRISHGFSGSVAGPAIMSLTAETPHPLAKLGARMGLYGTSIILATIIGWMFGGFLSEKMGFQFLFFLIALLLFAGAAMSLLIKEPPSLFPVKDPSNKLSARDLVKNLLDLLKNKWYSIACLGIFAHMMTMGALTTLLPLYVETYLNLGSMAVGFLLASYGLAALFFQLPMGFLMDKFGRMSSLILGFTIVPTSLLILSCMNSFSMMLPVMAMYGIGFSMLFPALTSMVIENSNPGSYSLASGFFHVMFTQGVVLGAPLFAFIAAVYGLDTGLRLSALAPITILLFTTALYIGGRGG